jgi:hypothetical protein
VKVLCVIAVAAGAAAPWAASAAQPLLYPIPVVFLDASRSEMAAEASRLLSAADSGRYFRDRFKASYAASVDQITDATSRRTFVVSLQIPRVSEYIVPKVNGTVERQLAMTGSLYFTNVMTGEVLFTYTATAYLSKTYAQSAGPPPESERAGMVGDVYRGLVSDLLGKSSAAFKPFEITAKARDHFGALVVLDKGARAGLNVGDALTDPEGGEAKVVFADADYAVAQVQMGARPSSSGTWSKYSARTLGDVRKAPAVFRVAENGSNFADDTIQQMFADAAGETSALSIVPVNAEYAQVVNTVRQQTDISRDKTATRRLPLYFLRVTVAKPVTYEAPTNIAYKTVRIARARVSAELVDQDGRVQFAGSGEDMIRDEVTAGMGYDPQARQEVAVKNAIAIVTRKLSEQLRLEQADLRIAAVEGGVVRVADELGLLRPGANITVLRDIGPTPGGPGRTYAPTWSGRVAELDAAGAKATLDLPVFAGAPSVRAGDIVRVNRLRTGARNAARLHSCGAGETLGSRSLDGFEAMAMNALAARPEYETYFGDFVTRVSAQLQATGEFEAERAGADTPQELCIEPVNRIDLTAERCDEKLVCVLDLTLPCILSPLAPTPIRDGKYTCSLCVPTIGPAGGHPRVPGECASGSAAMASAVIAIVAGNPLLQVRTSQPAWGRDLRSLTPKRTFPTLRGEVALGADATGAPRPPSRTCRKASRTCSPGGTT